MNLLLRLYEPTNGQVELACLIKIEWTRMVGLKNIGFTRKGYGNEKKDTDIFIIFYWRGVGSILFLLHLFKWVK